MSTPRKTRVVCVDDGRDTRAVFALMLGQDSAFEIVGCLSTTNDLEQCIARTSPDVVVLDLWIPGEAPLDVLRRMRARFADVRFLVLSSDDDGQQVERAFACGALGYAVKDGNYERLAAAIQKVAAGQRVRPVGGARNRSD